jgi:hypothetical protein
VTDAKLPPPEPSNHPVDVGLRSEAAILGELVRRGYSVLVPFGVNQRYDLVLDQGGQFIRVQCKTGRLRKGAVVFSTMSVRSNTRKVQFRSYKGEADYFLVYCPANGGIYAVPVDEAPEGYMSIRVSPPQNGQLAGVNLARDYQLPG